MVRSNRRGQANALMAIVALLIASFFMMSSFVPQPGTAAMPPPAPVPGGPDPGEMPFPPPLDPAYGPPFVPRVESPPQDFDAVPTKVPELPVDSGLPPAKEGDMPVHEPELAVWPASGPSEPAASGGDSTPVAPSSSTTLGDEDLSYAPGTFAP